MPPAHPTGRTALNAGSPADTVSEHVARTWFIGANPWLDYDTPANAIREDRLTEVNRAAQALIDDAFSG